MEIYLWEMNYDCGTGEVILLHLPGSDIWLSDEGYSEERIVNVQFTKQFWKSIKKKKQDNLTKIGNL